MIFLSVIINIFSLKLTFSADTIWVGKSDEAKSCAIEKAISLEEMGRILKNSQIQVLSKRKIRDKNMHIQMCGADKGDLNGYLIPKKDLEKAITLKFKQISQNQE